MGIDFFVKKSRINVCKPKNKTLLPSWTKNLVSLLVILPIY